MRKTTLAIFSAVTAATVIAAIMVQPGGGATTGREGELIFPELEERINDAARIVAANAGDRVEVVRSGEDADARWVVASKHGYPAKTDQVKKTLVVTAGLKALEPKTAQPELYPRLDLGDPMAEDAKSVLLTVEDADGATMAEIVVGKRHYTYAAVGPQMVYVREPEGERAWLAEGDLEVEADPDAWLDKRIVDVTRARLHEIVLEGPQGTALHIRRPSPGTEDWEVVDLPEDRTLSGQSRLRSIASTLLGFDLEDVVPAEDKAEVLDEVFRTATFRTFDGLVVTVILAGDPESPWATIRADYDAALRAEWEQAIAEADAGKPEDEGADFLSAGAVEAQAEAITRRAQGWAYRPQDHKLDYMMTELGDVTEAAGGTN